MSAFWYSPFAVVFAPPIRSQATTVLPYGCCVLGLGLGLGLGLVFPSV